MELYFVAKKKDQENCYRIRAHVTEKQIQNGLIQTMLSHVSVVLSMTLPPSQRHDHFTPPGQDVV